MCSTSAEEVVPEAPGRVSDKRRPQMTRAILPRPKLCIGGGEGTLPPFIVGWEALPQPSIEGGAGSTLPHFFQCGRGEGGGAI